MQWLNAVRHDVRNGWRLLRKSPVLSGATIATLALGIGLDAGVFTLLDGMLFRARVNDDPATFVQISVEDAWRSGPPGLPFASLQDYRAYRDGVRSVRDIAAWAPVSASLGSNEDAPYKIVPLLVTCNFFDVYDRSRPLAGRVFERRDCETPGTAPVAVVAEDLWRTRYSSDPHLIGSAILVNRERFTVVGIMPSGYSGQLRGGLWIPYTMASVFFGGRDFFREPSAPWLIMVGRLASKSSRPAAIAELAVVASQRDRLVPGRKTIVRLTNGSLIEESYMRPMAAWIVPVVMGALSLVFLIACANVAMLSLSGAAARKREMAVRLALGANRTSLLRMVIVESVMLAGIATPLSAYITYQVPILFRKMFPTLPFYPFDVDLVVFTYLSALTVLAGVLAGITPALESLRSDVSASLQGQETRLGPSGKWRLRDVLIAGQVGMSLVLMVAVGLFVRAEHRLATADPGFEISRVLVSTPTISTPPYTAQSAAAFYQTLADRVRAVAGVRDVAFAKVPPLGGGDAGIPRVMVTLPGQPADRGQTVPVNVVSPSFFAAVNIPIVRGRLFDESDAEGRVAPAIVSESLARAVWADGDAVGALVRAGDRLVEVVGIARDIQPLIPGNGLSTLYELRRAQSVGDAVVIRFDGDARTTARAVRQVVAGLDRQAVTEAMTVEELRDGLASRFMRMVQVVLFLGAVGVALAAIGIYGVVAFAATSRTREIGIRVALGATRRDIIRLVLSWGAAPIGAGLGIGAIGTALFAQAVLQIFGNGPVVLEPRDPLLYAAATMLLIVTVVAAMSGPARRAASADPVRALRQD